jgi:hypothetical protein
MKKIILPLLILVLGGAAVAYYMYNKPVESLDKKKADVEVSAEQLLADYEANEQAADDKYLGKVVAVTGKVAQVTTDDGKSKIHLETGNPISMVITELDEGNETGGLAAGDQATVKGMCSGYLSDVILVRSSVVK